MTRPLWQLLMSTYNPSHDEPLTCDECFVVLEYYAEQLATGIDPEILRQPVRQHLGRCSECRENFSNWLDRLYGNSFEGRESRLTNNAMEVKNGSGA
jgi:predicted anti-sigma-YlaC factor YlaD